MSAPAPAPAPANISGGVTMSQAEFQRNVLDNLCQLNGGMNQLKGDVNQLKGDVNQLKGNVNQLMDHAFLPTGLDTCMKITLKLSEPTGQGQLLGHGLMLDHCGVMYLVTNFHMLSTFSHYLGPQNATWEILLTNAKGETILVTLNRQQVYAPKSLVKDGTGDICFIQMVGAPVIDDAHKLILPTVSRPYGQHGRVIVKNAILTSTGSASTLADGTMFVHGTVCPGSSGSAVCDSQGSVVGIVQGTKKSLRNMSARDAEPYFLTTPLPQAGEPLYLVKSENLDNLCIFVRSQSEFFQKLQCTTQPTLDELCRYAFRDGQAYITMPNETKYLASASNTVLRTATRS